MRITAGTSEPIGISVLDTSSSAGAGLSALVYNSPGLFAEFRRKGASAWTAITLVAGTLGTYVSGGFIADGALGGAYEFCPPAAATATGVEWVAIRLYGATNMAPVLIRVWLDAINYQDAVRLGLTGLPNANAGANGGLPTVDASGQVKSNQTAINGSTSATTLDSTSGKLSVNVSSAGSDTYGGSAPVTGPATSVHAVDGSSNELATAANLTTAINNLASLLVAVSNLNNLSALANLFGPSQLEIPATGSIVYPFRLVIKDSEGHLEDATGTPTIAVTNAAGTDRSANLSAVTRLSLGVYTFTYTVTSAAAQEGLSFDATATAGSDATARHAYGAASVVSIDTMSTLNSIKATLGTAGAGLTALGDTRLANLDAAVSSRATDVHVLAIPINPLLTTDARLPASGVIAKVGDAMTLTSAYDAAKNAAAPGAAMALTPAERTATGNVFWNLLTSASWATGSFGAKFAAWVLGSDGKAMVSSDAGAVPAVPDGPTDAKLATELEVDPDNVGKFRQTAASLKNAPGVDAGTIWGDTQSYPPDSKGAELLHASGSVVDPGDGTTPVNHNTGGADNLRFTLGAGGPGIDGAVVTAYLASDYIAGNVAGMYLKGWTRTGTVAGVPGRWPNPLMLASGNTYTILFSQAGVEPSPTEIAI